MRPFLVSSISLHAFWEWKIHFSMTSLSVITWQSCDNHMLNMPVMWQSHDEHASHVQSHAQHASHVTVTWSTCQSCDSHMLNMPVMWQSHDTTGYIITIVQGILHVRMAVTIICLPMWPISSYPCIYTHASKDVYGGDSKHRNWSPAEVHATNYAQLVDISTTVLSIALLCNITVLHGCYCTAWGYVIS